MRSLKCSKSPGIDKVPTKVYKILADHLAMPLSVIFNTSIHQKVFPQLWKKGVIIPVPKTNPPTLTSIRYLTLLPVPSKILEKLVLKKLWSRFSASYGPEQHGFRHGASTTTALLQLTDDATSMFDDATNTDMAILSFDMSCAFDNVDHNSLLNIMSNNDFPTGFIRWLCNYLTDRSGFVKVDGCYSPEVKICRGVPQGSVLGPPIFCTYIGNINSLNHDVKVMKYADDISLVVPSKQNDKEAFREKLEAEIYNIEEQTKELHLSMNLAKSKAIIISRSRSHSDLKLSIPIDQRVKILGVVMNNKLQWDSHIDYVIRKASQRLHILRRLTQLVTQRENHDIYIAVVRSLLEYACPVYVGLNKTLSKKLQQLDNRAHRIIFGSDKANWHCSCTTLQERRTRLSTDTLNHIQKFPPHILHNRLPDILKYTKQFSIPFCRTEKRKMSFFPFTAILVNESPI